MTRIALSIAVPRARSAPVGRRSAGFPRGLLLLLLTTLTALAEPALADTTTPSGPRAAPDARARLAALNRPIKLLASRSHDFCPMGGSTRAIRTIDSRNEWGDTLTIDEAGGLGRRVLWSREKVLVYAEDLQPATGKQLESATDLLRLKSGVLWWPVRDAPGNPLHAGVQPKVRPCVIAAVNRATWHRVRVFKPGKAGESS